MVKPTTYTINYMHAAVHVVRREFRKGKKKVCSEFSLSWVPPQEDVDGHIRPREPIFSSLLGEELPTQLPTLNSKLQTVMVMGQSAGGIRGVCTIAKAKADSPP